MEKFRCRVQSMVGHTALATLAAKAALLELQSPALDVRQEIAVGLRSQKPQQPQSGRMFCRPPRSQSERAVAMQVTAASHGVGPCFLPTKRLPRSGGRRASVVSRAAEITFTILSTKESMRFNKATVMMGSGTSCDIRVSQPGPSVASEHVVVEQRRQGVFCRALVGEEVFDSSASFLDGTEMRPKVNYLLGTGSIITIGTPPGFDIRVDFEESSGKNALLEMMMQGMAAGNSELAKSLKL